MNKAQLFIISGIIFCMCCAMSKCNTPGPQTSIHGIVKDVNTGQPLAGIGLAVVHAYTGAPNTAIATATTNTDGTYSLAFTPDGSLDVYRITSTVNTGNSYFLQQLSGNIVLGKNNEIDLTAYKLLTVTINLKSTVNENEPKLELLFSTPQLLLENNYVSSAIVDTVFKVHLPELSNYTVDGIYYNPVTGGGMSYTPNFTSNLYLGTADTAINITNP